MISTNINSLLKNKTAEATIKVLSCWRLSSSEELSLEQSRSSQGEDPIESA